MIAGRDRTEPDQWQVQVLARVLNRAQVVVHADGLDTADLRSAHLGCTDDVSVAVAEALSAAGPDASLCVLPEGPQTIAYVEPGSTPPRPGP